VSVDAVRAAADDEARRRADTIEEAWEAERGVIDLDEYRETECPICHEWSVGECIRPGCEPDGSNMPPGFWPREDER